jgi:hypothetical protein
MKARIIALMAATSGVTAAHASTCSLIVLDSTDLTQVGEVIRFASATAVANYYGSNIESGIASSFFSDNEGCSSPMISFTRFPVTAALCPSVWSKLDRDNATRQWTGERYLTRLHLD